MFYAFIEDNKLVGAGECRQLTAGVDNVEISEEVFRNIERYVWNGRIWFGIRILMLSADLLKCGQSGMNCCV